MEHSFRTPLLVGIILISSPLFAQLGFGGRPYGTKAHRVGMPPAPVVFMPAVDAVALMAEDASRTASGKLGPFRFGYTHETLIDMRSSGTWATMDNGDRVWRVAVECPQALGINFVFTHFVVPQGARVFVYNANGDVRGGFTAASNPGQTVLGVAPLRGDRITVEYILPPDAQDEGDLVIGQVTHDYRDPYASEDRDFGSSGSCNINSICPEGDNWRPQIRSVARVIEGGGYCTGQLLNDCAGDGIPYFLTANHCTMGSPNYATWVFEFNWESPVCTPTQQGPENYTVSGCSLLINSPVSDVALLQLNSVPPDTFNLYYTGWDKSGTPPDSSVCIHHPSGDIKKISHCGQPSDQVNIDVGNGPADCWHIPFWYSGTTEPGSSGSGLWNPDGRLIGQLYGGAANCGSSINDYFGRFDVSYPLLEAWLGTCGDVVDGYDPNGVPIPMHDAGVTSIFNVADNVCNADSITPNITLKNDGTIPLSTVTIYFEIIGGASGNFIWTGSLAPGQTANVILPTLPVTNGLHTVHVYTSNPNGQSDQNPVNDGFTSDFVVSSPAETLTLTLTLDDFGTETTWDLHLAGSVVLFSGGPYPDGQNGLVITREFCVGDGCFDFTIYDNFGGICCNDGNGHYQITDPFGTVLAIGNGQFAISETRHFCLENVGIAEEAAQLDLRIIPNPSTGVFMIALPSTVNEAMRVRVFDATGRVVREVMMQGGPGERTMDLSQVSEGTYVLEAGSEHYHAVRRLVIAR